MLHCGYTRAGRGSSVVIADAHRWGHTPEALIQQRIRHGYRRQRPTPLPSRMGKGRRHAQLGVDRLDVACAA